MSWIAVQSLCSFTPFHKLNPFHFIIHFIHIIIHHPSAFITYNISPIFQKHSIFMIKVLYRNILQLSRHSAADQPFCSQTVFPQLQILKASTSRHQNCNKVTQCIHESKASRRLWRLFQRWAEKTKITKIK